MLNTKSLFHTKTITNSIKYFILLSILNGCSTMPRTSITEPLMTNKQIDNIETNIINSLSHLDKTNNELKKAEKYQSKRRTKCLYFTCIVGLVIIIVIIVLIN